MGYQKSVIIQDYPVVGIIYNTRSQLIDRLLKDVYELCGSSGNIEMHHVRKLKDLTKNGRSAKPEWMKRMIAMKRKKLWLSVYYAMIKSMQVNITECIGNLHAPF